MKFLRPGLQEAVKNVWVACLFYFEAPLTKDLEIKHMII